MSEAFAFMLQGDAVIFTSALALMGALGLVAVLGIGGLDAPIDAEAEVGGALDWLGLGRLPFIAFLVVLLATFGIIGLVAQQVAVVVSGDTMRPLLAVPIATLLAFPTTAMASRGLAAILPRDESSAVHVQELVGRTGIVVTGTATAGSPARARISDRHGHPHHMMIEPAHPDDRLVEGQRVLLTDRRGDVFEAVAIDNPFVPTALES